jgi:DNA-binding NarL/FixJ family response regulator
MKRGSAGGLPPRFFPPILIALSRTPFLDQKIQRQGQKRPVRACWTTSVIGSAALLIGDKQEMGNQLDPAALNRSVVVVGSSSLQNKLLVKLIGEQTGYPCLIRAAAQVDTPDGDATSLALLDAAHFGSGLRAVCERGAFTRIAVFNAEASVDFEQLITYPGVNGVFHSDTSEDHFIRGIEAIFRGEYWLPRRILSAHLERTRTVLKPPVAMAAALTRKEIQTLSLLATGNSTERIAHELNVSPHTVKTHIYNLFRKINVRNRVQAVQWAAVNVPVPAMRLPR